MKDKEVKFGEMEVSHTLGETGEVTMGECRGECVIILFCHTHLDTSILWITMSYVRLGSDNR